MVLPSVDCQFIYIYYIYYIYIYYIIYILYIHIYIYMYIYYIKANVVKMCFKQMWPLTKAMAEMECEH